MGSQKYENSNDNKPNSVYGKIVLSLENCLLPREKLEDSPSVVDGLDAETEYDLRIIGCELIQTAGILLKLPQVAMATGQVLLQRFYYCKSFVRHPMDVTAMGCICLASKIEEAPRRVRDVINVFHHIRQVRYQKPITPLNLDQQYSALKIQVIKAERRILKELGFCVHVKHPHKLIVCYLQVLTLEKNRAVIQTAWNYMNDSLKTDVFLRYSPETVACACIYLTARKLKVTLPKNPAWYELFSVNEDDISDICRRIVALYRKPKIDPDVLENKVEILRKNYEEDREKLRHNVTVSGNNTPTNNSPPLPLPQNHHKSPSSHNHHKSPPHNHHKSSPRNRDSSLNHKSKIPTTPPLKTITTTINVKRSHTRLRSETPETPRSLKNKKKIYSNHRTSTNKRKRSRSRLRSESPPRSRKPKKYRHSTKYDPRSIKIVDQTNPPFHMYPQNTNLVGNFHTKL